MFPFCLNDFKFWKDIFSILLGLKTKKNYQKFKTSEKIKI